MQTEDKRKIIILVDYINRGCDEFWDYKLTDWNIYEYKEISTVTNKYFTLVPLIKKNKKNDIARTHNQKDTK